MEKIKGNKLIGFSYLRVLCVFLIVFGHMFGQTIAAQWHLSDGIATFLLLNILGDGVRFAINCFIMISAWFLIDKSFSGARFVNAWLMTFIINVVITVAMIIAGKASFMSVFSLQAFLPIIGRPQWYMCEYLILLLIFPYLNLVIRNISRRQHRAIIYTGLILIVAIETCLIIPISFTVPLFSEFIWFVFVYFIIAYLKIYEDCMWNRLSKISLIVVLVMAYGLIVALFVISDVNGSNSIIYMANHFKTDYAALLGFVCSLCLFQIAVKINNADSKKSSLIELLARNSGYIYIIHSVPVLWRSDLFNFWNEFFFINKWYEKDLLLIGMIVATIGVSLIGAFVGETCTNIVIPKMMRFRLIQTIIIKLDQVYE